MINKRCDCCPKDSDCCNCGKYIVLQDFWLEHIQLKKGQVITEPVSPRWIELRLIAPYKPNIESAKAEAERIARQTHFDRECPKPDVVTSETIVPPKRKKKKCPPHPTSGTDTVIVELPEKSEMLLNKMIQAEVDSL